MSQSSKLNLWQKLKRLFRAEANSQQADTNHQGLSNNAGNIGNASHAGAQLPSDRELRRAEQLAASTSTTSQVSQANRARSSTVSKPKEPTADMARDASSDISSGISSGTAQNTAKENARKTTNNQPTNTSSRSAPADTTISADARAHEKQITANTQEDDDYKNAPITQRIQQFLNDQQWHFLHHSPKADDKYHTHHLSMRMQNDDINWVCLFRIQERSQLVAVYGILPFSIPETHRSAALLLTAQLNYDMILGNLEMDLSDGEVRYKTALDIEATGMSDEVLNYLIQSVIAMTTVSYELFNDLLETAEPSQDLETLLGEIRQQADARTFYLPSENIQ